MKKVFCLNLLLFMEMPSLCLCTNQKPQNPKILVIIALKITLLPDQLLD